MTYKTCPKCGANLDAGERCDCEDRVIAKRTCRYCYRELERDESTICFGCEDHRRDEIMSEVWAAESEGL